MPLRSPHPPHPSCSVNSRAGCCLEVGGACSQGTFGEPCAQELRQVGCGELLTSSRGEPQTGLAHSFPSRLRSRKTKGGGAWVLAEVPETTDAFARQPPLFSLSVSLWPPLHRQLTPDRRQVTGRGLPSRKEPVVTLDKGAVRGSTKFSAPRASRADVVQTLKSFFLF